MNLILNVELHVHSVNAIQKHAKETATEGAHLYLAEVADTCVARPSHVRAVPWRSKVRFYSAPGTAHYLCTTRYGVQPK